MSALISLLAAKPFFFFVFDITVLTIFKIIYHKLLLKTSLNRVRFRVGCLLSIATESRMLLNEVFDINIIEGKVKIMRMRIIYKDEPLS